MQTKVATGDKPDLAFWQPTASMLTAINAKTNLQPLDDAPWLPKLAPDLRDITGKLDGTRYAALITSPAVEGVYYNKEVFAANGITDTPKNFDDMVTAGPRAEGQGRHPVLRDGRRPVGHPVVGAGPARRRREERPLGPDQHQAGDLHQPGRARHHQEVQGPDRRRAVQRRHQDGQARGPERRAARRQGRHGGAGQLVLRPAAGAGRHGDAGQEDRLLPDRAVGSSRHLHPRPVQRAGRLPDRGRQARGRGPAAAGVLDGPGLRRLRRRPQDRLARAVGRQPARRAAGPARRAQRPCPRRSARCRRWPSPTPTCTSTSPT